ncbi:MAG: hypothetical protein J5546_06575 [Lachnospiraceae bacterium]|nr:hypothetical protein [Lachnospiraceae bacterium]
MENHFFETEFRFDKYLGERLLEISDEGERRALKDVLSKTLLPFYEQTEEKYHQLEDRLFTTERARQKSFDLITGIIERNRIDVTEDSLYPMNYADLSDVTVDIGEMMEKIRAGKPYTVFRVFLKADVATIQRLERENKRFHGTVITQEGEYRAEVRLVRNQSYLKQVADLYPLFENNGIRWKTVCMPYLRKFYDVQVCAADCPEDEVIREFRIDFGEYASFVRSDLIPVWNVRFLSEKTGAYPDLAVDRVHYEHCIYRNHFREGRSYLVAEDGVRLWDVFLQDGDMHIVCSEKDPRTWKLLEVNDKALHERNAYPVYHNGGESSKQGCIHTKAEVKRYIDSLGLEELTLVDMGFVEDAADYEAKTYSMDPFLEDEIRVGENREMLLLRFRAGNQMNYLNYDLMSYLVSRVQWELPEFLCVGELA